MYRILIALCLLVPLPAAGQPQRAIVASAVDEHVLPGYRALAKEAAALDAVAARDCNPASATLRKAYNATFDAWMAVAHLRFGPSEAENRAFSLAFWPDTRGAIRETLVQMIDAENPAVDDPEAFAQISVAGRGLFALEAMLYDETLPQDAPEYSCRLTQAIADDIARTAADLQAAWTDEYADLLRNPGPENPVYYSESESIRELYGALMTGLEFTIDQRLARPLGTFERPRPRRAEAWRSGRSLRNVTRSVEATGALAQILARGLPEDQRAALDMAIVEALEEADGLQDPAFKGVSDPTGRLRIEVLRNSIADFRDTARDTIGTSLGVSPGFNSLDGD